MAFHGTFRIRNSGWRGIILLRWEKAVSICMSFRSIPFLIQNTTTQALSSLEPETLSGQTILETAAAVVRMVAGSLDV